MIDIHVDDIIIIHIVYPHSIFIIGTLKYFVGSGVDLCIKMIFLCTESYYRVATHKLSLVEYYRMLVLKRVEISLICSFHQLEYITILRLKLKEMSRLFDNSITYLISTFHYKGIGRDIEVSWHAGRVRIIDGVALHPKDYIFAIFVYPHTL